MPPLSSGYIAFGVFMIAAVGSLVTMRPRTLQYRAMVVVVFLGVASGFAASISPALRTNGYWACAALSIAIAVWARVDRSGAGKRWLERASVSPIVLRPPFADRWRVAAGGPDPSHNHHQIVSDQYFAYDFLRVDGESWDQPILAPCAGMIVHVESRRHDAPPGEARSDRARPFGNYVSIETPRGYVILAHLREGSVTVRVGDTVAIGQEIGRCGNSGNTRGAHLHVHAQNQPSQSVDVAEGVPIAFLDRGAPEPMLLEYGDTLG